MYSICVYYVEGYPGSPQFQLHVFCHIMVQDRSLVCIVGHVSFWNAGFSLQGVMGDPPVGRVLPQKLWEGLICPPPNPPCRGLKKMPNSFIFMQFLPIFAPLPLSGPQNVPLLCLRNTVENPGEDECKISHSRCI